MFTCTTKEALTPHRLVTTASIFTDCSSGGRSAASICSRALEASSKASSIKVVLQ